MRSLRPCSDSSATPSFPSQPEGKIGLPRANPRGPGVSRTWVRRPIPARTLLSALSAPSRRLAGMVMDLAQGGRRAPQHLTGMWKSSPPWLPANGFLTRPDVIATTRTLELPPPARPPSSPGKRSSRLPGLGASGSRGEAGQGGEPPSVVSASAGWPSSRGAFCGTLPRRV